MPVSKPAQGEITALDPLSGSISAALAILPFSTPLQVFSTLRIKAFERFRHKKPALQNVRWSFAPRRVLFRFCFGSMLETRFVLLGYIAVIQAASELGISSFNHPNCASRAEPELAGIVVRLLRTSLYCLFSRRR